MYKTNFTKKLQSYFGKPIIFNRFTAYEITLFIIVSIAYFCRIFYLESDLPAWGLVAYQPIDEGSYANLALNIINFGSVDPNDYYAGGYEYVMQAHIICNAIGNCFTLLSLLIFGDNYYGLRIGVVLAGYFVYVLFCLSIKEIDKQHSETNSIAHIIVMTLTLLSLLFSFVFFNATKAVEPSIFRLLFIQLVMFLLIKNDFSLKLKGCLVGFFTIMSILLVYTTNLFLGIPVITYLVFVWIVLGRRQAVVFLGFGIAGAIAAYLTAFIYYGVFWDTTPLQNALNSFMIFQPRNTNAGMYSVGVTSVLKNIRAFIASNAFFYCLPIVFFVGVNIRYLFKAVVKEKDAQSLVMLALVIGFLLQTSVSDDYVIRKAVVILPTVMLLAYKCFLGTCELERTFVKTLFDVLILIILICIYAYVLRFRFAVSNSPSFTYKDFSLLDKRVIALSVVFAAVIVAAYLISKKTSYRTVLTAVCLITCIFCNGFFVMKYNVLNQTYSEKEVMIELGEKYGDSVIAGEFENGYTLYNSIHPLLNTSDTIATYMRANPDLLYFDYYDAPRNSNDPDSLYQHIVLEDRYSRDFQTFGYSHDVAVFSSDYHNQDHETNSDEQ